MATDLALLFESLVLPLAQPSGDNFSAIPIPGFETHRLAKDVSGAPCLLLRQPAGATRPAPIRLQNLLVAYDVPCTITFPSGAKEQESFTILRCSDADPRLFAHFLKIVSPVVAALGAMPTSAAVRQAISGLVQLFQALTAPAKKSIQGVWAELFLIRNSSNPMVLTSAWHRLRDEHFDFVAGPERLEVKSSSNRRREHYFSLAQLSSTRLSRVVIASVFVERVGGGFSLRRLFEEVRSQVVDNPALAVQFDSSFYAALGTGWADVMDESFDWELAEESLAFFDAELVPRVANPVPPTVTDVRFRSDLSGVTPIRHHELRAAGVLFPAATPAGKI